jgi:hypothetical protein
MRKEPTRTPSDGGSNSPLEADAGFPIRWRGYDRRAVDRYVGQLTSDYRRLEAKLAFLDHLIVAEEVREPSRASMTPGGASNDSHHVDATPVIDVDPTSLIQVNPTPVNQAGPTPVIQSTPDVERSVDATVDVRLLERWRAGRAAAATAAPALSFLFTSMSGRWPTQQTIILVASVISGLALSALLYSRAVADGRPRTDPAMITSEAGQRGDQVGKSGSRRMTDIALSPLSAGGDPLVTQGGTAHGPSALMVLLHAERECWVRATVDGKNGTDYLLKAGAEITLRAADEVLLRIGDASALTILVNGEPLGEVGRSGEVVTRRITRDQTRQRTLEAL